MNTAARNIKDHEKILKEEIFFTKTRWPHFDLLFENIKKLSKKISKDKIIICLERNLLYGGLSLFAPFFKQKFISIDCYTEKLFKRGNYNKHLIKNKKLIKITKDYSFHYKKINLGKTTGDLIIIPNLLHHVEDVESLILQSKNILKKNGYIYIFEPLLRELHQTPEDYGRFTPYGLQRKMEKLGFINFKIEFNGGPFTAAAYCWDQAIQYLPSGKRKKEINWLNKNITHYKKLDLKYSKNLIRKNTKFPVSFSILAQKK